MKTRRRFPLSLFAAALIACTAGCDGLLAPDLSATSDDPTFDLSKPADVVQAWAWAFDEKNYDLYDALLDAEFQFFPRAEDAVDFPWMIGPSWDRVAEMEIAVNMFDPEFSGEPPPVSEIVLVATVQSQSTSPVGRPLLTCGTVGSVLTGPVDGFAFHTRVEVELILRGATYRVLIVRELGSLLPLPSSVEAASLGSIKNLFR